MLGNTVSPILKTPARQLLIPPSSHYETICPREVLLGAREVTRAITGGARQIDTALRARGVVEYGIGMMLYRIQEKGLMSCCEAAYESLLTGLPPSRTNPGTSTPATRRTVLDHLRKNGFLSDRISVRNLKPAGTTPTAAQVLETTEEVINIPIRDIISQRRSRDIVRARFFAMWAMRHVSGTSFAVIGENLGGKDHTSVINGVSQVELKRDKGGSDLSDTNQIVDQSDYLGIRSNMDILIRQVGLRLV